MLRRLRAHVERLKNEEFLQTIENVNPK